MKRCFLVLQVCLVALALSLAGCPKKAEEGPMDARALKQKARVRKRAHENLAESSEGFYKYLQWQKWVDAANFIEVGDSRRDFIRKMKKEPLKLTEFDIMSIDLDPKRDDRGVLLVALTTVRQSDLIVEEAEHTHAWYTNGRGKWYIRYPYVEANPPELIPVPLSSPSPAPSP